MTRRATSRWPAYVPLAAAVFELPWLGAIVIAVLFTKGDFDIGSRETQLLDLVALLPPVVGMATGTVAIARGTAKTVAAWVSLVAGFVLCGLLTFSFGWELTHPEPEAATQIRARSSVRRVDRVRIVYTPAWRSCGRSRSSCSRPSSPASRPGGCSVPPITCQRTR
jgi:hypothetical protein